MLWMELGNACFKMEHKFSFHVVNEVFDSFTAIRLDDGKKMAFVD